MAVAEYQSPVIERVEGDAGTDRQHACRAQIGRHRSRIEIAERRIDSLPARSRAARFRMLCRGEARIRSPVAGFEDAVTEAGMRHGSRWQYEGGGSTSSRSFKIA